MQGGDRYARVIPPAVAALVLVLPTLARAQDSPAFGGLAHWVQALLHAAAGIVGILAVLIMLWGVAHILWRFLGARLFRGQAIGRDAARAELGYYILLGLELLIIADIIETIVAPDLEHVLMLGLIVLIRTVIAFSLNWELNHESTHRRRDDA